MIKLKCYSTLVLWTLFSLLPCAGYAELAPMTERQMSETTGQAGVEFSILGEDTMRFYFDIHAEIYAEIDSIKLGYYHRTDLTTRKFMGPTDDPRDEWDPHLELNDDGTFNYRADNGELLMDHAPYHVYKDDQGKQHYLPYVDNDYYMNKYTKMKVGELPLMEFYAEGVQGNNDAPLLGIANLGFFSKEPSQNTNYMDWDINLENVRLGISPEEPVVIDGLIVHMKYDSPVNDPDKRLTDIIIGTNSMEGDFFGEFIRTTGLVSGKLADTTKNPAMNDMMIPIFTKAPIPVSLKRDSFLSLIDHYKAQYNDPTDGDGDDLSIPSDPTNNQIHTGMFLRLGLDPDSENFGFAVIAGYNEIVANAYKPQGEMIKESITNWWKN